MASIILLRWTKIDHPGNDQGYFYESNLVKINGRAAIQVELPNESGISISYLVSLTGERFVSIFQDYFASLHANELRLNGVGQIVKFRINKLPEYAIIQGEDLTDAGDPDSDSSGDSDDVTNGFAGSEEEYFRGNTTEIFAGQQS